MFHVEHCVVCVGVCIVCVSRETYGGCVCCGVVVFHVKHCALRVYRVSRETLLVVVSYICVRVCFT